MKVMQLSRCCLFNKNCLLRSASSNFCRGKSENLTKASTKIIPSRWITSGPSKVRTLTCPQNIDGGFSRAPIIGRFKAFLFRLKYPKFKFWDAVDGCKEVTPLVGDLIGSGNFNKLEVMVDSELLKCLMVNIEQQPWIKTLDLGEPNTKFCFWHSFWETKNEETGALRIAIETALYMNWAEPNVVAVAQHFVFQRYITEDNDQDWIVTNYNLMRMDK
ncbi:uncharacterized protein LOC128184846 [Crassostrea angulata]|uniref:uncharacterized protein LOC128184846 n=1 Tax=Magallana angulata TaxID=2784310 RepID=UPI0022B10B9C|nr:uncharacterized protein LOC128184846 [Crassostrea angulata]